MTDLNEKLSFSKGEFSKTAYWFSRTMRMTLYVVSMIAVRYVFGPSEWLGGAEGYAAFCESLDNIALLIAVPNAILAGSYGWKKKLDNGNQLPKEKT